MVEYVTNFRTLIDKKHSQDLKKTSQGFNFTSKAQVKNVFRELQTK